MRNNFENLAGAPKLRSRTPSPFDKQAAVWPESIAIFQ